MRCSVVATLYVFLLASCKQPEPEIPVGLHGPFPTQLNFTQLIGEGGLLASPVSAVAMSQCDALTFAFRLPSGRESTPIVLDVHAVDVDDVDAGPCDAKVAAFERPPRWPALGVGTVDFGLLPRSRCADAGRLRVGSYEARLGLQGETIAARAFTVVAD